MLLIGKNLNGTILHLDGDKRYSEKSIKYYKKLGLNAIVRNIPEYKQPKVVKQLLGKYNPDILVITGHDAMIKSNTNFNNIYNYKYINNYFLPNKKSKTMSYLKYYCFDII